MSGRQKSRKNKRGRIRQKRTQTNLCNPKCCNRKEAGNGLDRSDVVRRGRELLAADARGNEAIDTQTTHTHRHMHTHSERMREKRAFMCGNTEKKKEKKDCPPRLDKRILLVKERQQHGKAAHRGDLGVTVRRGLQRGLA